MKQYPKRKMLWKKLDASLVSFTFPVPSPHKNRKYQISIRYQLKSQSGPVDKFKTINFGLREFKTKIEGMKTTKSKRKGNDDYFHPHFWEELLLNTKSTLEEGFLLAVEKLIKK